jgi:hypothetical protein
MVTSVWKLKASLLIWHSPSFAVLGFNRWISPQDALEGIRENITALVE